MHRQRSPVPAASLPPDPSKSSPGGRIRQSLPICSLHVAAVGLQGSAWPTALELIVLNWLLAGLFLLEVSDAVLDGFPVSVNRLPGYPLKYSTDSAAPHIRSFTTVSTSECNDLSAAHWTPWPSSLGLPGQLFRQNFLIQEYV